MNRHPNPGVLRRLVDEPAGVTDADRAHVAGCADCLTGLADATADATAAGAALRTRADDVDVPAAWDRLSAALPAAASPARTARRRGRAPRAAGVRRPLAAAVAFAAVLSVAGVAAANDWLPVFRTEQVAPVAFDSADLVALPDLSAYGTVEVTGDGDLHTVADPAAAAAETALDVPEVAELPGGVVGDPSVQVGGQASAVFTFSNDLAAQAGGQAPPAGLDGSQVRLVAGPGVAQIWSSASGVPALVVATAVAPSADSSGVPFQTLRDYLLSLPGLPDDLAAQLRTFTADGSTLPLPVPADLVDSSSADVDGVTATVLESRDRSMAAVVWVEDGVVTAVAGSLGADEVLEVARGLR
ncbi:hypothetical protein [Klenkia terrae]|uniref:DUF4367 domain-containing protein n=1 Tax=Klenkia terrae TaxID=1052259 RepID=A0ABU8EC52_9ACTN